VVELSVDRRRRRPLSKLNAPMTGRVQDKATTIAHPSLQNQRPVTEVVLVPRDEASLVVSHTIVWVRERENVLHRRAVGLVVCPLCRDVDSVAGFVGVVVCDAFAAQLQDRNGRRLLVRLCVQISHNRRRWV
jgi:hypothetical protein